MSRHGGKFHPVVSSVIKSSSLFSMHIKVFFSFDYLLIHFFVWIVIGKMYNFEGKKEKNYLIKVIIFNKNIFIILFLIDLHIWPKLSFLKGNGRYLFEFYIMILMKTKVFIVIFYEKLWVTVLSFIHAELFTFESFSKHYLRLFIGDSNRTLLKIFFKTCLHKRKIHKIFKCIEENGINLT